MTETRLKVTDVNGGRSSSQTGAGEIDLVTEGGDTAILGFEKDTLLKLLGLSIQLCRMPAPLPGQTSEVRTFTTAWWTLGKTPDDSAMILTFEIEGGGHIGFRVPMDQARNLYDAMIHTVVSAPAAAPGVTN